MIIRNCTTKTLKASPLNNRGVRSTPGCRIAPASTLEGSPACCWSTPPECTAAGLSTCRGCSLRSYPRLPSEDRVAVSFVVTLCALRELHLELCGEKNIALRAGLKGGKGGKEIFCAFSATSVCISNRLSRLTVYPSNRLSRLTVYPSNRLSRLTVYPV